MKIRDDNDVTMTSTLMGEGYVILGEEKGWVPEVGSLRGTKEEKVTKGGD